MPVASAASNRTEAETIKAFVVYMTENPELRGVRTGWPLEDVGKGPSSFYPSSPPI